MILHERPRIARIADESEKIHKQLHNGSAHDRTAQETGSQLHNMRKISESTVRRLSLYLRFLEQFDAQGHTTVSSAELARRGATTSAQVRKDLSFFGSFGKRGLGYSVPQLTGRLREILGLKRTYRVVLVGAGRIGGALAQYPGFRQRRFHVAAVYDKEPREDGPRGDGVVGRDVRHHAG